MNSISDVIRHKNYPTPKGKSDVIINLLVDQDINCKNVTYEVVTNLGATAGLKRKRAEAIGDDDDEELQDKKNITRDDVEESE